MILLNVGSRLRREARREDGQALIEFTLTLIFYLMLLFGILDLGRAIYTYHFVSNTAREAARFAAVHGETCNLDADGGSCTPTGGPASSGNTAPITDYVASIVPTGIVKANVTATPTWSTDPHSPTICTAAVAGQGPYSNYPGCTVQVTVSYPFSFLAPIISTTTLTFSSSSEMVIAH